MDVTKTEKFLSITLMDSQGYEQNLKLENPKESITRQAIENAISDALVANASDYVWVSSRGYKISSIKSARQLTVTTVSRDID